MAIRLVAASSAPSVTTAIRKAEAAQLTAKLVVNRLRKRLTLLLKKGKSRTVIVARAAGKGAKGRTVRVASRARSSS
jgi:hypothetical protein